MGISITAYIVGIAGVFVIGFLGTAISRKTGIPSMSWLLLFGILIGQMLDILSRSLLLSISPIVAARVLIIVLSNAGTRPEILTSLKVMPLTLPLTFANYIIAAIAAMLVMPLFHFSLVISLLMGAIVGGTSAAGIPTVSREAATGQKVKIIVTLESIITDPVGIMVMLALIGIMLLNNYSISFITTSLTSDFSIGIIIGAVFALLWIPIMGYLQKNKYWYSYAASLAMIFLLCPVVQYLRWSGPICALRALSLFCNAPRCPMVSQVSRACLSQSCS